MLDLYCQLYGYTSCAALADKGDWLFGAVNTLLAITIIVSAIVRPMKPRSW